ncbi:hypothetical protein ISS312_01997 [Alteromonas mediterranea]|jgi:hypothetical protein|nr:hypothetical protein ISS312_01997 [Alteromonas mediterranea]
MWLTGGKRITNIKNNTPAKPLNNAQIVRAFLCLNFTSWKIRHNESIQQTRG